MFRVILEKSTDVNAQEKDGWTALEVAIRSESEIAVKEMLKRKDVDVNLKNKYNHTALHYAFLWKNMPIELFKIILEKLTDINAQDENGNTALHWAIGQENRTAVEELLKRDDVNVNLKNNQNLTALHVASVWVDIPIDLFRVILEKSTDVNAQEEDGNTALHLAIMYKSATALKELLKCEEIDFNLNNNKNQTARFLASLCEDMPIDLLSILLEK
jgi:E3 ubiquitin-protein ligase mind-bomb